MTKIHSLTTSEVQTYAANYLSRIVSDNSDRKALLLVSGGSALKILGEINPKYLGSNITISTLDERFSSDESVNNFLQIKNTEFFKRALSSGCNFLETVPKKDQSLESFASEINLAFKNWKNSNPNGVIIITQGMGPDGHTAGIMPYPDQVDEFNEIFDTNEFVVGYSCGDKSKFSDRITVTPKFLIDEVDYSILYVVGIDKKSKLQELFTSNSEVWDLPISIIHAMKSVEIFTDQSTL